MKKRIFLMLPALLSIALVSCSDDDAVTVSDDDPNANFTAQVYATSNSDGNIRQVNLNSDDFTATETQTFLTLSTDAEGIYYDAANDEVTQASRSLLQLSTYANISGLDANATITASLSSSTDLVSPRDIAVNGDFYVVSDNADVDGDDTTADGRFFVYTRDTNGYTLRNTFVVGFKVWGIEFVGNDLYAVVDTTSDLAVFENFTSITANTQISPTKRISIEGIGRTHGLGFDGGTMILTDIGDATVDTDGGFHIITDFVNKFNTTPNGGTLAVAGNQVRVAGNATFLGNPVSVDYDAASNTGVVAERANNGGRFLVFTNAEAGGNIAPVYNTRLAGASSVYYSAN